MKMILLIFVGFLAFLVTLAAALAATGNLSPEAMNKIFGKTPETPAAAGGTEAAEAPDESDRLAQQIKDARDKMKQREAALAEEEKRVKLVQRDLVQQNTDLKQTLAAIQQSLETQDAARTQGLQEAGKRLAAMEPKNAALALAKWPPEDVAVVLRVMKEKESGPILDAMAKDSAEQASQVLRALQEKPATK